jgi:hypothetical protein
MTDVNGEMIDERERKRRKIYMLARELGLTREDRIDLAEKLLWRDVESWKDLAEPEIGRMLDALEGFELISFLRAERFGSVSGELVADDGLDAEPVGGAVGGGADDVAGSEEAL